MFSFFGKQSSYVFEVKNAQRSGWRSGRPGEVRDERRDGERRKHPPRPPRPAGGPERHDDGDDQGDVER